AEGEGSLTLGPSFAQVETQEITSGSYTLLLMLAELDARRLPQQGLEEYHQCLHRGLARLDRADGLGVQTRASHLCRARYLTLLGDAPSARKARKERDKAQALAAKTELDPQDHFLVGHELYSQDDVKQASAEFQRALQLDPGHFWSHYFLGICRVTSS